MDTPGQNTGVGSLSLLQGIFSTQGSNPGLPHCRQILYQLSHRGSPRILEWVAYPFSSRSSRPRTQIRVSCIAGGFFTSWAIVCAVKSVFNSDRSLWATFLYWRFRELPLYIVLLGLNFDLQLCRHVLKVFFFFKVVPWFSKVDLP